MYIRVRPQVPHIAVGNHIAVGKQTPPPASRVLAGLLLKMLHSHHSTTAILLPRYFALSRFFLRQLCSSFLRFCFLTAQMGGRLLPGCGLRKLFAVVLFSLSDWSPLRYRSFDLPLLGIGFAFVCEIRRGGFIGMGLVRTHLIIFWGVSGSRPHHGASGGYKSHRDDRCCWRAHDLEWKSFERLRRLNWSKWSFIEQCNQQHDDTSLSGERA